MQVLFIHLQLKLIFRISKSPKSIDQFLINTRYVTIVSLRQINLYATNYGLHLLRIIVWYSLPNFEWL